MMGLFTGYSGGHLTDQDVVLPVGIPVPIRRASTLLASFVIFADL
jgi:hypothetical protein